MKPALLLLLVTLAVASFGFSAMAPQPQQTPPAHVWRESLKTDAARGTAYNRYTLTGKFLKEPKRGDISNRPALVVDCRTADESRKGKGKFESASLLVGTNLKIHYIEPQEIHGTSYFQKVFALVRLNDGKDEEKQWVPGSDKANDAKNVSSASIPKDDFKKMLRAQTVDITQDDDGGSPIVMKFDMPDPMPVEQGCNVDE